MKHFYSAITGEMTTGVFIAALFFASLGWFLYKSWTAKKRDVSSSRTPQNWDWKFWIKDNIHEAFIHGVVMFLLIRFAPDLVIYFAPDSADFFHSADPMLLALVLGFAKGYLINKVKKNFVR